MERHADSLSVSGLVFAEASRGRVVHSLADLEIPFIGRADLVKNKRASGRPKDLADLDVLEGRANG